MKMIDALKTIAEKLGTTDSIVITNAIALLLGQQDRIKEYQEEISALKGRLLSMGDSSSCQEKGVSGVKAMSEQKQERREMWLACTPDGWVRVTWHDKSRVRMPQGSATELVHVREVLPGDEDLRGQLEEANESLAEWKELCRRAEKQRDDAKIEMAKQRDAYDELTEALKHTRKNELRFREDWAKVSAERDDLRQQLDRYRPIHGSERLPTISDAIDDGQYVEVWYSEPSLWIRRHIEYVDVIDWWRPIDNTPPPSEPEASSTSPELPQGQSKSSNVVTRKIYDQRVEECEQLRARVAELEQTMKDSEWVFDANKRMAQMLNDERQRRIDETASRLIASSTNENPISHSGAYDVAEALEAERERRVSK